MECLPPLMIKVAKECPRRCLGMLMINVAKEFRRRCLVVLMINAAKETCRGGPGGSALPSRETRRGVHWNRNAILECGVPRIGLHT